MAIYGLPAVREMEEISAYGERVRGQVIQRAQFVADRLRATSKK